MLRRRILFSSPAALCCSRTTPLSLSSLVHASSHRCQHSSSSSSSSSSKSKLSDLVHGDPDVALINKYCSTPDEKPEVVIIVDGTALLYRIMFSWRSYLGGRQEARVEKKLKQEEKQETDQEKEAEQEGKTSKKQNADTAAPPPPPLGLETDPTGYLHRMLPRFFEFMHTLVPLDYDPKTQKQSSSVLPPELVAAALKLNFLKPSGGPYSDVGTAQFLAKRNFEKKQQQDQKKKRKNKKKKGEEKDGEHDETEEAAPTPSPPSVDKTDPTMRTMLAESIIDSPGLLRRRVIVCFDHGREHVRADACPDYKGHRPHCGRFASFVSYATALIRQLHSCTGIVHSVLPPSMEAVRHDGEFCLAGTPESAAVKAEKEKLDRLAQQLSVVAAKNNNDSNNDGRSTALQEEKEEKRIRSETRQIQRGDDDAIKSLLRGATVAGPLSTPDSGEADDLIATCVEHFTDQSNPRNRNRAVVVVSHDKDLLQLLRFPRTYFYSLGRACFITEDDVKRDYHLRSAAELTDWLTLRGDRADNVLGLERTGSQRASGLIQLFGSVEGLVAAARAAKEGDFPDVAINIDVLLELEKRKKLREQSTTAVTTTTTTSNSSSSDSGRKKKGGKKNQKNDTTDTDADTADKTTRRQCNAGRYEKGLFENVRKNAEWLLRSKKDVIGLRNIESCAKFLADADQQKNKQQTSDEKKLSTFFGAPTILHQFPRDKVFSDSKAFRRRFSRPSQLSLSKEYRESNKNNNSENGIDLWGGIRKYFIANHGACGPEDEKVHHCGSYFLSAKSRQEKKATELGERRSAREMDKQLIKDQRLKEKEEKKLLAKKRKEQEKRLKKQKTSPKQKPLKIN